MIGRHNIRLALLGMGACLYLTRASSLVGFYLVIGVGIWAGIEWLRHQHRLSRLDVILAIVVHFGCFVGAIRYSHPGNQLAINRNTARLQVMNMMYYLDDNGELPPSLNHLGPYHYAEPTVYLHYPQITMDWLYFPCSPDNVSDPASRIIVATPVAWNWRGMARGTRQAPGDRIVGYLDGSAELLPEAAYQEAIRVQQGRSGGSGE